MTTDWEAKKYEQDAIAFVVKGDYKAAFKAWKDSNACRDICPDIDKQNFCCARHLEGRLVYLSLIRRDEDYSHHASKLKDWIETETTG